LGRKLKPTPAALGFRVKSGWAMAVLLSGPISSPSLLCCKSVLLSDPKEPGSKQPYHVALELPEKESAVIVRKLRKIVGDAAKRSVEDLLTHAADGDYVVRGAGLVVGSLVDPASLHNEHIRAHGLEGQLFRTVLEDAFRARAIPCAVLLEKTAYATAAGAVRKNPAEAKRIAADLGESHDGSWRAEEKLAAVAAWMALAMGSRGGGAAATQTKQAK
jgi:hypothetical protein